MEYLIKNIAMQLKEALFILGLLLPALPLQAQSEHTLTEVDTYDKAPESSGLLIPSKEQIKIGAEYSVSESSLMDSVSDYSGYYPLPVQMPPNTISFFSDYSRNDIFAISKHTFIFLEGEKYTYQNLGSYILAFGAVGLRINSKLSIMGGLLALKQFTGIHSSDRSGTRFLFRYQLSDRVNFDIWGQYLTDVLNDASRSSYRLLPKTEAGAAATMKIGNNSQVGVTTRYQYDPYKEKWNSESSGNVKINF